MNSTYATSLGVWDNTQLIVFDPNSQALGNIDSYLNATGEPNERAFLTPFSLYYNFGFLMRYSVEFSSLRKLKTSWRDIIGLTGVRENFWGHLIVTIDWVAPQLYQSVNLYTIGWLTRFIEFYSPIASTDVLSEDPIPINGISQSQYQMTSVLYPAWGISPGGLGFGVTEDFRTHTIPALLASLGGLWTILNALFSWLFGRTLLFPVFGKNLSYLFHAFTLFQHRHRQVTRLSLLSDSWGRWWVGSWTGRGRKEYNRIFKEWDLIKLSGNLS